MSDESSKGRWYPEMPPMLDGEMPDQYTDRLTGADGMNRRPYDHRRFRQCSIGYHEECSDPFGKECECPCHAEPDLYAGSKDWKEGMLQWFGESWHAPLNKACRQALTPVGLACEYGCDRLIEHNDQGMLVMSPEGYRPYHRWCFSEMSVGPAITKHLRQLEAAFLEQEKLLHGRNQVP